MSRTSKRERQKTIRALLAIGLSTSAFAAVAGTFIWAWSPQTGGWILTPQQDIADVSRDSPAPAGRTWVPPQYPELPPFTIDEPPADVAQTQSDEPMQIASVETKGSNSSGYGPLDFGPNENSGGGNFYGLFNSNGGNPSFGGGQGGSWNGTFNPNGGGSGRPGAFASYSGGSGGGSGQSQTCEPGKIWNGSACVTPTPITRLLAPTCEDGKVWNGSACVAPPPPPPGGPHECPTGQSWNGTTCVATTSGLTGQQCEENKHWNGTSCVANTSDPANDPTENTENHSCGTNKHWNGTSCVANTEDETIEDETNNNGSDPSCGTNQHWNGTICVADDPANGGAPTQTVEQPVPDPVQVPEPGTLLMSLAGLLGLGWSLRRRA